MGSSTEHSAYGPTHNPWDLDRIPGGSGGGSAAAVAAFEAPLAIGTDTGGSIRQPGAVTGTVGVKPTYGGVSRYGLVALANSLDQAGPVTRTVLDAALLHEVIGGHDPLDSTSIDQPVPDVVAAAREGAAGDLTGVRIGVVTELGGEGYQDGVLARFQESVELMVKAGAEVVEVSCPNFVHALATYYLILPAEASSNLAKFDAMRYGLRVLPEGVDNPSAEEVMRATRDAGFGDEVKRRIILGTYALSSGYYDAYYGQAQKVRTLIARDFEAAFEQADVLVSPTAPTTAFKLGEKLDDPLAMYLNDLATIPANLSGVPGISVPSGLADEDGLPAGVQILAPALADDRVYRVGAALEALLLRQVGRPPARPGPRPERRRAAWRCGMTETLLSFDDVAGERSTRRWGSRSTSSSTPRPRCSAAARRSSAPSRTPRSARPAWACPARCRWSTARRSSRRSGSASRSTARSPSGAASRGRTTSTRTCRRTSRPRSTTSRSPSRAGRRGRGRRRDLPGRDRARAHGGGHRQVAARRRRHRPDPRRRLLAGRLQPRRHPADRDRHQADHGHGRAGAAGRQGVRRPAARADPRPRRLRRPDGPGLAARRRQPVAGAEGRRTSSAPAPRPRTSTRCARSSGPSATRCSGTPRSSTRGGSILQETRHWHEDTGVTTSGREKSDAEDYRYFPEPDLVPVAPTREWVDELRGTCPSRRTRSARGCRPSGASPTSRCATPSAPAP